MHCGSRGSDMLEFDIWTILFSVINILVLFFFLKKFLFGRVNAILEKRAQMVQADLQQAKQHAEEADQLKNEYEQTLRNAKNEAKQLIQTAQQTAYAQGNQITAQAQQQAEAMMEEAQKEIARERQRSLDSAQKEIASLALAAACKVVGNQVDDDTNRELVDAFLAEEGVAK